MWYMNSKRCGPTQMILWRLSFFLNCRYVYRSIYITMTIGSNISLTNLCSGFEYNMFDFYISSSYMHTALICGTLCSSQSCALCPIIIQLVEHYCDHQVHLLLRCSMKKAHVGIPQIIDPSQWCASMSITSSRSKRIFSWSIHSLAYSIFKRITRLINSSF